MTNILHLVTERSRGNPKILLLCSTSNASRKTDMAGSLFVLELTKTFAEITSVRMFDEYPRFLTRACLQLPETA